MDNITNFVCHEGFAEVQTKAGKLRGFLCNDVYSFYGVKYAEAKRFQEPKPVEPWEGVTTALDYGYVCPVPHPMNPKGDIVIPHKWWVSSEDCLNLNVWTTSLDTKAKKPVMVWLHGGGYTAGNAIDLIPYHGANQAHYGDVVAVTVNHRLNVWGFLDLSEYGEEYQASGNVGIIDIREALQWVHDNIEQFGGDPDNVTIYGHSGGGGKVTTLMQMPSADGLYHRAIIQSGIIRLVGPANTAMRITKEKALENTHKLLEHAGGLEKLLAMSTEEVMQCCREAMGGNMNWTPVPGAGDYPGDIGQVGFREETKNIPVMIGSALCEFPRYRSGCDKSKLTEEEKLAALKEVYGDEAEEIKATFEECYPGINSFYATGMDMRNFRPMCQLFCDMRNKMTDAPVYEYVMTYETAFDGGTMSAHGTELAFCFHNAEHVGAVHNGEKTWVMQDEVFGAWTSFARTGNPNHDKMPQWDPYTKDRHSCMVFGSPSACKVDHDGKLIQLMNRK